MCWSDGVVGFIDVWYYTQKSTRALLFIIEVPGTFHVGQSPWVGSCGNPDFHVPVSIFRVRIQIFVYPTCFLMYSPS